MASCTDTIFLVRPSDGATNRVLRRASRLLTGVFRAILRAHERAVRRRMLAALDDRMLKDLGLSRADVEREYRKPFWVR